jgi:hypothetical protein
MPPEFDLPIIWSGVSCRPARFGRVANVDSSRSWHGSAACLASGIAWGRAVQEERECAALLAGKRGCRLGQLPDPGIQERVRVVRGVPVVGGALVVLASGGRGAGACRPGTGARPACHPGSGFPLRR